MTISKIYSRIKKPFFYASFIFALACAGGPDDNFMGYFQPETSVKGESFSPYHFSLSFVYGSDDFDIYIFDKDSIRYSEDDNLRSWLGYVGGNYTIQEAGQAIYRSNISRWGKNENEKISDVFLKAIEKKPAAMKYLKFAWTVESVQRQSNSWSEEASTNNPDSLKLLLPVAEKMARTEKDPFLKERYAFQAIKVNGELRNLDEEIKLFDEFFAKNTTRSVMYYWAESRIAGAYLILGDTARAVYHFGQVFENCPSKRWPAYMSLRLNEVQYVPQALSYCKSGKEKAGVYSLCAVQPWQESIDILHGMLEADPSDSLIRLVFVREINKAEYDRTYVRYLDDPEYLDSNRAIRKKASDKTLERLKSFAAMAHANPNVSDHAFWLTAQAHCAFLLKEFPESKEILDQAEKLGTTDSLLLDQMLLEKFLLFSELTKEMTPEKEAELLPMLVHFSDHLSMEHANAFAYAANNLSKLYSRQSPKVIKGSFFACNSALQSGTSVSNPIQNAEAKAFLFELLAKGHYNWRREQTVERVDTSRSYEDLDLISYTVPSKTVDATIEYFNAPNVTSFDATLKKMSNITTNPLYRLLGTRAMIEHKYDIAVQAFSHIDTAIWNYEPYRTYLNANPFWTGIRDTHASVDADSLRYNPLAYARRMNELANNIRQGGSAEDCFELACGAYNMTSWGNSWLMIQNGWTGSDEMNDEYWYYLNQNTDSTYYFLVKEAEQYFNEAAARSTDKEFKARAYFMAAKCEQKRFYYYMRAKRTEYKKDVRFERVERDVIDSLLYQDQKKYYRLYFRKLLTDYADTKFNSEARSECAYYDMYAKGK
jgi:hypothetical protein